ncbi:metallophosphoesterase family protein [Chloroflexota bacterium]
MKTDLKWFHVSDMHFGGIHPLDRRELADYIRDTAKENLEKGWKPDFVAISGDIAYSAEQGQYSDAICFLDELLQILELQPDRVSMCPGNHDIDRSINQYLFQGSRTKIVSGPDIEEFLRSPERTTLLERMARYSEFRKTYLTPASQLTFDSQNINAVNHMRIDGLDVQLCEMNSAWLGNGGEEDIEKLVVGSSSLNQFIKVIDPAFSSSSLSSH